MAFETLVSSDWHLLGMYKVLGGNAPKMQFAEINKVYMHAVENGFNRVCVPGDISDVPRLDEENFILLVTHLMTWGEHVETIYMRGNHDVEHKHKTSLDVLEVLCSSGLLKNFRIVTRAETRKVDGINLSFLPWPEFEAPLAKDGRGRLIFAHIDTAGAIGDNGRPLKSGNEERVVRTADDFIISGHIHQYQEMKSKRLIYNGNLYQKNFGEKLPKGFIEVKAGYKKGSNQLQVRHQFINSKPNFILENVVIADQSDWSKLKADPNIRYKVFIDQDGAVVVPKNITQVIPNIVSMTGVRGGKAAVDEALGSPEGGVTSRDLPTIDLTTGLSKFLKSNGLKDKDRLKRARSLVRDAMRHVGAVA